LVFLGEALADKYDDRDARGLLLTLSSTCRILTFEGNGLAAAVLGMAWNSKLDPRFDFWVDSFVGYIVDKQS
jgi:hypothetical protein